MYNSNVYEIGFEAMMTTNMIRKQIYIKEQQQEKLHKIAEKRGISEAEVIRQAIEQEYFLQEIAYPKDRASAFAELLKYAQSDRGLTGEPYQFNREEIYEEREKRWNLNEKQDPAQ
jgi:predicted transcriptional regulator